MKNPGEMPTWKSISHRIFLGFGVVILLVFGFMGLSDYSWYVNWISLSHSALVLGMSVVATFFVLPSINQFQQVFVFLICLASSFLAFSSILFHRYHSNEIPVQVEVSPDKTRFIEVYCSFTPAHVTGFDHFEIIVRNVEFPFLQRDLGLYNNYSPQQCRGIVDSLVRWEDNDTIYVTQRKAYLPIGFIKWDGILSNPGEINGNN